MYQINGELKITEALIRRNIPQFNEIYMILILIRRYFSNVEAVFGPEAFKELKQILSFDKFNTFLNRKMQTLLYSFK